VGMLIILLPGGVGSSVGPREAARLAALGITSVALLEDNEAQAFVVEGWAFDPAQHGSEARDVLSGDNGDVRTLHQVMGTTISRTTTEADVVAPVRLSSEPLVT
jgi:hypothetical protein